MADVGEVKYKVVADDSGLDGQITKTESKLKTKFGSALKAVGAAAGAAIAGGSAAVVGLVKQATQAYGEYEQLVGGVETLFGDSASQVMEQASEAFKTAGMSMNDYMETSIQSAAAMINSLGGDQAKAAELMDMSITDMADNVNKMGTDMEAVQNAYRGFSRGNFTMLDNLALGFAGTKEGMQELLDKAEEISGYKYDISSYSDIVQAIHVVQEEMGITGTTAKEAATTFQGSLSSMQSAWQNLVTGMADPDADIGQLVGQMIDSAKVFLENAIPIVEQAITGIGTAVEEIAPVIAEKIPKALESALPGLLASGAKVVESLANGILSALPALMPTATNIILDLVKMLISLAPKVMTVGIQVLVQLANGIAKALPTLIPAAVDAIIAIVNALTDPNNLTMLIEAAIAIIMALLEGLIEATPKLVAQIPIIIKNLVQAIFSNLPMILTAAGRIIATLIQGMLAQLGAVLSAGNQVISMVKNGIMSLNPIEWGRDLISSFVNGIRSKIGDVINAARSVADKVRSYLHFSVPDVGPLADFDSYAPDMMNLFAKGIDDNTDVVEDSAKNVSKVVNGAFTTDIGYNLPDITGYAQDLTASMTSTSSTEIIVPLSVNGREIARASAWYMNEQLAWEAR